MRTFRAIAFVCSFVFVILAISGCKPSDSTRDVSNGQQSAATDATHGFESEAIPDVVAMIGDRPVTRDAYIAELKSKQRQLDAELSVMRSATQREIEPRALSPAQRQTILGGLVSKLLLEQLAEEAEISVSDDEVAARMAEGINNLRGTEGLEEYLDWYQITEAELRAQIHDQILTERFLRENLTPCEITDAQARAKYDELLAQGKVAGQEEADFWHILLALPSDAPESDWEKRRAEIDAIRELAVDGEDIESVAVEVSEDPAAKRNRGLYEYVPRGALAREVDDYVFTGPIGEISEPIRSNFGWHLVKVKDRRAAGPRTFDELADRIREVLRRECDAARADDFTAKKSIERGVKILYTVPGSAAAGSAVTIPPRANP